MSKHVHYKFSLEILLVVLNSLQLREHSHFTQQPGMCQAFCKQATYQLEARINKDSL